MPYQYHTTENAVIEAEKPQNTVNMTAQEIVQYMTKHFKTGGLRFNEPQNKSTAYLMAVSKAIFDPKDWRNPCKAIMPQCGHEWAKAAVIWYHGAEPKESFIAVYSPGYQCW